MWYEILPAMGIIFTAVTVPQVATFFISKLLQSGNGLDNIPDVEPEGEQGKSKRKLSVQEDFKEEVVEKCTTSIQEDKAEKPIKGMPEVMPKSEVGKCVTSEDMFKIPEKDDKK